MLSYKKTSLFFIILYATKQLSKDGDFLRVPFCTYCSLPLGIITDTLLISLSKHFLNDIVLMQCKGNINMNGLSYLTSRSIILYLDEKGGFDITTSHFFINCSSSKKS